MNSHVQGAASFSKNIMVLQAIADANEPPTVGELIDLLKMPRPTLYRLLSALEAERLIEQGAQKKWRLGPRLVQLASKSWQDNDLRNIARPILEKLRDETGETNHLAIRNGDELMYVDKVESNSSVRMTSTIGARVPFYSTSVGKAFLMALGDEERERLLKEISYTKITPYSVKNRTMLKKQLKSFNDFSFEKEENEVGVACYGCAILNAQGFPVGAVSVSIPLYRMKEDSDFYTIPLIETCGQIGKLLPPF